MEVKEKSKKRELIKTIAIIFLVILLILTFFSGTFMNYSLPEVATQLVTSGTINAKIRGSGTVSANENYEVVINQTREIRSVCVKVGDAVEQGDLLFVLGDVESQELKDAQSQLETMELDYQKQILNLAKEHATDSLAVQTIRADLEKAIAQRDANHVTDTEVTYAKGDLAAAEAQLRQVETILAELTAIQAEDEKYNAAKEKVTELEGQSKELSDKVKACEEELKKLDTDAALTAERLIQDAQDALEKAKTKWSSDWAANAIPLSRLGLSSAHMFSSSEQVSIEGQLGRMKEAEEWASANTPSGGEDGEGPVSPGYTGPSYAEVKAAYDTVLADQQAIEEAQKAYDRAVEDRNHDSNTIAQQRQAIQQEIASAQQELGSVRQQLSAAQQELDAAASANTNVKEQLRSYEAAKRDYSANITTLEAALADLTAKQELYKAAVETIEAKQKELQEALSGKDIDSQLENLDLQAKQMEIERQRELVEKYRTESVDTEVTAKVSGVISSISVTAGKENVSGQAMATIDVVDQGFTIKISVTNDQAKQVKVGDTADVTSNRWGSDITATLEAITSDPSAPGQKKMLVFRVTGDVEAGSTINLSVGQRSMSSDTIVPKSALREDSNGKFVLIVTSRSTPLGNRYTATRVDVEVMGEDDNNAAVSGVAANDYVITTSSKPLDAGTLVRMVENP